MSKHECLIEFRTIKSKLLADAVFATILIKKIS